MSQFMNLHYDQYQRYRFSQEVVNMFRETYFDTNHKFRILDVGGLGVKRNGNYWLPMKEFLPLDEVIVIDTLDIKLNGYIQGDGTSLPFVDGEFDIVMTNDVLEHIPAAYRNSFCNELKRVSKNLIVLTAPFFSSTNALAEKIHYEYMLKQINIDHGMLGEHLTNGTPDLNAITGLFKDSGFNVFNYGTGNVYNWLLFSFLKETVGTSNEVLPMIEWIDSFINQTFFESEMLVEPAYRHTMVISNLDLYNLDQQIKERFLNKKGNVNNDLSLFLQMFMQFTQLQQQNEINHHLFYSVSNPDFATVPLKNGDLFETKIHIDENNLSKIAFLVGTHGKKQNGILKVTIFEEDNIKYTTEFSTIHLRDNEWYTVSIPPLHDSKDKLYTLTWQFFGEANPGVSLWCSNQDISKTNINGQQIEGTPCIKLYKRSFGLDEKLQELYKERISHFKQISHVEKSLRDELKELKDSIDQTLSLEIQTNNKQISHIELSLKDELKDLKNIIDKTLVPEIQTKNKEISVLIQAVNNKRDVNEFENEFKQQEKAIEDKERHIQYLDAHIQHLENHVKAMESTWGWRLLEKYRRIRNFIKINKWRSVKKVHNKIKERGLTGTVEFLNEKLDQAQNNRDYDTWFRSKIPTPQNVEETKSEIKRFDKKPLISIVMPTYNTEEIWLRKAIESVLSQIYVNWELCICDDFSTNSNVWEVLREYARLDNRIKVVRSEKNLGIAGSTNKAIELSAGDYVGFLDHDDELTIDALYEVVKVINENDPDLIYTDEDKLEMDGTYSDPFFKPDWSPDYLLSTNYICHFAVYKKKVGEKLGWIRLGFDGAQDYDFVLRFSEEAKCIRHIPKILYHWRKIPGSTADSFSAKSYAQDAGKKAVEASLERKGIIGNVKATRIPGHYKVNRAIEGNPLVSIIIPTKDKVDLLSACINSIKTKTNYSNYEIIVINNRSEEKETYNFFEKMSDELKVVDFNEPFNYSRMNNVAIKESKGDLLLFLNNDTEVIEPGWLSAMVEHAVREEVGVVGAKLLFANDTIQHAGVILGVGGVANHAFLHLPKDADGYFGMLHDIRNCSAVTAACMLMRRDVFEECGGFDESNLPVAFNDVDLSLKIVSNGYLCIWTPDALLYHHESATRTREVDSNEVEYMKRTWAETLDKDPFYNSNFDRTEVVNSYSKLKQN
jgi:GT2 family glycosyltransferase